MTDTSAAPKIRPLSNDPDTYHEFDIKFQQELVYACASSPRLYSCIGTHLIPDLLADEKARHILQACRHIAAETGTGPSSLIAIVQRFKALEDEGKLSRAKIDSICGLFEIVEDRDTMPTHDEMIALAAPHLRRRGREKIIQAMIAAHGKGKPLDRYAGELQAIEQIGQETPSGALALDSNFFGEIYKMHSLGRLPTGIERIDSALCGGFLPGLAVWGALTNVGKTAVMIHQMCFNLLLGKRCIYLCTEENAVDLIRRVVAWIVGVDVSTAGGTDPIIQSRFYSRIKKPGVGAMLLQYVPPGTSVGKIRGIIEELADSHPQFGGGYDVAFVDYPDKLGPLNSRDAKHDQLGVIYSELRKIQEDHKNWMVVASQLKLTEKKIPDELDLSNSKQKGETADHVVCFYKPEDCEDNSERSYHIAKVRGDGKGTILAGLPTDFEHGRIACISTNT